MTKAILVGGQPYLIIPLAEEIAVLFAAEPAAASAFGYAYANDFHAWCHRFI